MREKKALGVFLDLSKAFDTVSHRILLERLENIGIRGVSLQLFKTNLSNRLQQVRLGDIYSRSLVAEFGVPQGTVLGRILLLYRPDNQYTRRCKCVVLCG